jgi:DNA-binding transcriptional LysR family regulator
MYSLASLIVELQSARRSLLEAFELNDYAGTRASIGSLAKSFLPDSLARFRKRFPLIELTVLHTNHRAQSRPDTVQ